MCDVTVEDDVVAAVARAAEPSGGLDILFACAGGSMTLGPILNAELNGWRATLDLNLVGTMLSIKHAAARMVEGGGGSIIAMSSIAGHSTHRLMSAYCVGKAGIDMLVKVAADELGEHNIRVNAVQPGLVDTDLVGFITAGGKLLDDYFEQMPVSRVGTVEDIAAMVAFLAGPDSTWITGQIDRHRRRPPTPPRPQLQPAFRAIARTGVKIARSGRDTDARSAGGVSWTSKRRRGAGVPARGPGVAATAHAKLAAPATIPSTST